MSLNSQIKEAQCYLVGINVIVMLFGHKHSQRDRLGKGDHSDDDTVNTIIREVCEGGKLRPW